MKNTMRKISEKERERIKEMTPMNDIMMQAMFEGNDRLVEYILRLLTGIKDLRVIKMDIQKVFKANLMYRSIRVDIYASDSKGREYNMEVQNDPDDANGDRARYHMGMMDTHAVIQGDDIILPPTYVVFIMKKTNYKKKRPIYHFTYRDISTNLPLDTGSHIIYFDLSCKARSKLRDLQHDFLCKNPKDMRTALMRKSASWCKETKKGVKKMCEISRSIYEDGYSEGERRGKKQGIDIGKRQGIDIGKRQTVLNFVRSNKISIREGADELHISVSELKNELNRQKRV